MLASRCANDVAVCAALLRAEEAPIQAISADLSRLTTLPTRIYTEYNRILRAHTTCVAAVAGVNLPSEDGMVASNVNAVVELMEADVFADAEMTRDTLERYLKTLNPLPEGWQVINTTILDRNDEASFLHQLSACFSSVLTNSELDVSSDDRANVHL